MPRKRKSKKSDIGKLSGDESLIVELHKVAKNSCCETKRETANSLLMFYMRNKTLTVKQRFIARRL